MDQRTRNLMITFKLSEFPSRRLMVFIFKGFRTIVFIFIVICTTFRPICPPAFFRCLSNSGTYSELQTTPFTESMGEIIKMKTIVRKPLMIKITYKASHSRDDIDIGFMCQEKEEEDSLALKIVSIHR